MRRLDLVAAIILLLAAGSPSSAQEAIRTITVAGEGEQRTDPDHAVLSLGIVVRGSTLDEAKAAHDRRALQVLPLLRSEGVEERDIKTGRISIQPIYRRGSQGEQVGDGYQVSQWLTVTVRELERWEGLLDGLLEAGITNLSNATFHASDVEKLRSTARRRALQDAQRKAAEMASVLGERVGRPVRIEEQGTSGGTLPYLRGGGLAAEAAMQSGPVTSPGEIVIRARVQVTFELRGPGI